MAQTKIPETLCRVGVSHREGGGEGREEVQEPHRDFESLVWCFRVLGFGVWGLGFGVWGSGFEIWGLALRVWGLGFRFRNAALRVQG